MVLSEEYSLRREAVEQLRINFAILSDKEQAWSDLIRLTKDIDSFVRWRAVEVLGLAFSYCPDKKQAWTDLVRLTKDEDIYLGKITAKALVSSFNHLPEKEQAWQDLIQLIQDVNGLVRRGVSEALSFAFYQVPDKDLAWQDLHQLTQNKDDNVRWYITSILNSIFIYIPDKKHAWEDLICLAKDVDRFVRWRAASALGSAFLYVPDKEQAWEDLLGFPKDMERSIRVVISYSMGRASILKAANAQNEEDFREELENALKFFEEASREALYYNPASFCLPFYSSFYTITFKKHEAEVEVEKYLDEAKSAIKGSTSREKLFEAIENLANALREIQNLREMRFDALKSNLNAYRRYCERAASLLDITENDAPGATKLIKRGLPIINKQIKEILAEIQNNAEKLSEQTKDTPFEDLGIEVNQIGQNFSLIRDPIGLEKQIIIMENILSNICDKMLEEETKETRNLLEIAKNEPIEDKLPLINIILSKISSQMSVVNLEKKLDALMISLKPGTHEELVLTVGAEFLGSGMKHVITIPLQEISYSELKEDLGKIKEKRIEKFSLFPQKLVMKIKDFLIKTKKDEILEMLS